MYRTVFNFNRWESIKGFINGLGKLSLHYILKVCKVKFYYHLLYTANALLLNLFWLHYGDCYAADDCLRYVFGRRYAAINAIYSQFRVDCLSQLLYCTFYFYFFLTLFLIFLSFLTNKRVH